MSTRTALIPNHNVLTDFYSVAVYLNKQKTQIDMSLYVSHINTSTLPHTFVILKEKLPSILKSQCFNDDKIPFYEEVKQTEIGHLFEHILLEYLCMEKLQSGAQHATYSGVTDWNWRKEAQGTFHITIDAGQLDKSLLKRALDKTVQLTNIILSSSHSTNVVIN